MLKILPYKAGSQSVKNLSEALGGNRILKGEPNFNDVVLNWGNNHPSFPIKTKMLNLPVSVALATNKVESLKRFKSLNIPCPDFTTDMDQAEEWLRYGYKVVARSLTRSHGGKGITVLTHPDELIECPLYTKYIPKKHEFRVHVFYGQVIDYSEKKARLDKPENFNQYIRSWDNGWVFCRNDIKHIQEVKDLAIRAVQALRLDFGAVDVIHKNGRSWVLEVNSAPGIEGLTLDQYVIALEELRFV